MKAEAVLNSFKKRFGNRISEANIVTREHKLKDTNTTARVWFTVNRSAFKDAVKHLCKIHPDPHFSVSSGYDLGDSIVLIYHFTLNYASNLAETIVNMRVKLPKKNPVLPTITDIIPGALISEREKQEMLGVNIEGIPDARRVFLPDDFPQGVYPWRRDGKGPHKLIRNLHKEESA
jgi:membrane-bound hydrogenase subunit beta